MSEAAYGRDLTYIHDAGFGGFAAALAPGLLRLLRSAGIRGGLVVDLGCGSGIWARALTDAGYDALGVDISAAMLALARRRAPAARFVRASLLRFEPPPCAAVTSLGECVNYLFDESAGGLDALGRMFRRVHDALRPGGVFVCELAQPGQERGPEPRRGHREAADWAILFEVEEDPRTKILTRRMTTFRDVGDGVAGVAGVAGGTGGAGGLWRRSEEIHRQRLYETAEVMPLLTGAGFRVRVLRRLGTHRLAPAHVAFVATRPDGAARAASG
ncbi:MAG TPA: class I SAM-dependent methyltransferase [Thermoanaerobaculia bacterium]|jgi:SAM-dependent methyltransferase|nr:class I SAM-dependent methyltransferase [Thermoanaerobaculia bacterium]